MLSARYFLSCWNKWCHIPITNLEDFPHLASTYFRFIRKGQCELNLNVTDLEFRSSRIFYLVSVSGLRCVRLFCQKYPKWEREKGGLANKAMWAPMFPTLVGTENSHNHIIPHPQISLFYAMNLNISHKLLICKEMWVHDWDRPQFLEDINPRYRLYMFTCWWHSD